MVSEGVGRGWGASEGVSLRWVSEGVGLEWGVSEGVGLRGVM